MGTIAAITGLVTAATALIALFIRRRNGKKQKGTY